MIRRRALVIAALCYCAAWWAVAALVFAFAAGAAT
jgi:hypothetical protein